MNDDVDFDCDPGAALAEAAWWSTGSLLSAEAAAITAFTFAVLCMFGGATIASVVAQSLVGGPWSEANIRWDSVVAPGVALLFALGAMVLGRRVILAEDECRWSSHLARAAVVVAVAGGVLSAVAVVTGVLRGPPGS